MKDYPPIHAMHQGISEAPPRNRGSVRRHEAARPDLPYLITALSDASSSISSKSPARRRRCPSDEKILRGAHIIRQQLLHHQKAPLTAALQPQGPAEAPISVVERDPPDVEVTKSVSSDEFSDPWRSTPSDNERILQAPVCRPAVSRLRQRSRPWNRDHLNHKFAAHPESVRRNKLPSWSKTAELTNIEERPSLVEQDDSQQWDVDTPPVRSLASYSFPEHGDAALWAEPVDENDRPASPITEPPPKIGSSNNSLGESKINQAEHLQDSHRMSTGDLDCTDKKLGASCNYESRQLAQSNEFDCSGHRNVGISVSGPRQIEVETIEIPIVTPTNALSIETSAMQNSTPPTNVVSPMSAEYDALVQNDAYRHAMSAGYLWQSLVGQHVRFPRTWWKGSRSPPMGMDETNRWMYIARHRVQSNVSFNELIRKRNSPGRILLHIVVRDLVTWKPVQDLVIGCFHSNARGVRDTEQALPKYEQCREIWMAIRKRCDDVSVVDCLLAEGQKLEQCARESPLMGSRHHVTNVNIRAIFGEEPPVRTLFILESELYERLIVAAEQPSQRPPALILLQEFFTS